MPYNGINNPALDDGNDNVQLTSITPTLASDKPHPSPSDPSAPHHRKPQGESDVYGLCCSSSGHVPRTGREESGDVTPRDPAEAEGGRKRGKKEEEDGEDYREGHSQLERQLGIEYSVTDVPPVHMCVLFGLQVILVMFCGCPC